jgi:MoaD family protein
MIKLRLFASLREIAGSKEVEVEGSALSICQALEQFAERFGERARQCLFDKEGRIFPSVLLLVNGEATGSGGETQVKSGDVVSVLLPTAGG